MRKHRRLICLADSLSLQTGRPSLVTFAFQLGLLWPRVASSLRLLDASPSPRVNGVLEAMEAALSASMLGFFPRLLLDDVTE